MKTTADRRIPEDVLEQLDTVFATLMRHRKALIAAQEYGLQFGLSPALRELLGERYGKLGEVWSREFF